MFSKILISLLAIVIVVPVWAEDENKTALSTRSSWLDRYGLKKEWKQQEVTVIYDGSGRQYKARRGDKMAPKMVTDSIKFFDGVAIFTLNAQRGRERTRLTARSENDIHILGIYNVDVDSTVISRTLDTIKVYSASAANDSRAEINLMVQ